MQLLSWVYTYFSESKVHLVFLSLQYGMYCLQSNKGTSAEISSM